MEPNRLYYGDNLDVLRRHVADESVDLVYLDPPFKSNQDYNVLFAEHSGARAASQIKAFEDTWTWDLSAAEAFEDVIRGGGHPAEALSAFMVLLGPSDMLAYLSMMAPRLIELRRVLKSTGTIYLHCDPTASHYLKLLLDSIFGASAFLNEIIWHYQTSSGSPKKWLIRNHDTILRYAAGDPKAVKWDPLREPWPEKTLKKWQTDEDGRIYRVQHKFDKRYYIDPAGKLADDVWELTLASRSHERLGFPTQKPLALLERILQISSDEGDVVLDPFCGCGTTVAAAQQLNRRWIGIDITHLAVNLIRHRLRDAYGPGVEKTYQVIGEPTSIEDAQQLAGDDPYQFQWWALGLVGARPVEQKKGADRGIDGTLFFLDEGKPKRVVISVKAGKTGAAHIRDLRGVIERDEAAIGVLISMQAPTAEMRKEAASAGFYRTGTLEAKKDYPRMQLLTVADLLGGKDIAYPMSERVTFKKAPKASGAYETEALPLDPTS